MKNSRLIQALTTTVFLLFIATSALAQRGGQNIALLLDTSRDFTGNITATDRTWFYLNQNGTPKPAGDGIYPSVEVSDDGIPANDIDKAVYVRGSSITLVVTLKTYTNNPDAVSGTLSLSDAKFVTGGTEYACSISGPATVSVPGSGGTQNITLTFTGLPNFVAKGQLKFKSSVTLTAPSNGQPPGHIAWGTTASSVLWPSTIYLTDQTPTGHQTVPWTDLLDYSCTWAHGYSGISSVVQQLTLGIFWSSPIVYSQTPSWYFDPISGDNFKYKLSLVLYLMNSLTSVPMDCTDVSGLLHLIIQSQGQTPSILRIDFRPTYDMITNPICPIGSDASQQFTYVSFTFGGHQVLLINGVSDATAAQWQTPIGSSFRNPVFGWSYTPYVQNFPNGYPNPVFGLIFGITPNSPNYPNPDAVAPNTTTVFLTEIE